MSKYYQITILSIDDNPENAFNPKCYPDTYEEANEIARPWIEQGYDVVITTKFDVEEGRYINIPLDTWEHVKDLTEKQAGIIYKNIYSYFFNNEKLTIEDPKLLAIAQKQIKRILEAN